MINGYQPQNMWNEHQAKEAQYRQLAQMQMQGASAMPYAPPPPPIDCQPAGVISMTEEAHLAFERLKEALNHLESKLQPLIEPYPCAPDGINAGCQMSEASAVIGLRVLVDRIVEKTGQIQTLTNALRV